MTRIVYDITALSASLRKDKRFQNLCGMIDRFDGLASTIRDLEEAQHTLAQLLTLPPVKESGIVARALLSHAVIAYFRASGARTTARTKINLTKALTGELPSKHAAILDLRNAALAHYQGSNGGHAQGWVNDAVILKEVDCQFIEFATIFHTRSASGRVAADLAELLEASLTYARHEIDAAKRRVSDEFTRMAGSEPDLRASLKAHVLDTAAFFPKGREDYLWKESQGMEDYYIPPNKAVG